MFQRMTSIICIYSGFVETSFGSIISILPHKISLSKVACMCTVSYILQKKEKDLFYLTTKIYIYNLTTKNTI